MTNLKRLIVLISMTLQNCTTNKITIEVNIFLYHLHFFFFFLRSHISVLCVCLSDNYLVKEIITLKQNYTKPAESCFNQRFIIVERETHVCLQNFYRSWVFSTQTVGLNGQAVFNLILIDCAHLYIHTILVALAKHYFVFFFFVSSLILAVAFFSV